MDGHAIDHDCDRTRIEWPDNDDHRDRAVLVNTLTDSLRMPSDAADYTMTHLGIEKWMTPGDGKHYFNRVMRACGGRSDEGVGGRGWVGIKSSRVGISSWGSRRGYADF